MGTTTEPYVIHSYIFGNDMKASFEGNCFTISNFVLKNDGANSSGGTGNR